MPARLITYPTKSATLSAVSPVLYSAQNTEVNQIYQDLNDLDAGVALKAGEAGQNFAVNNLTVAGAITVQSKGIMIPGFKMGGIAWQSASTPSTIKGGSVFEYRGLYYPVAADQNLASGDSALACNQSFDLNLWYKVIMDSAGVFKWMPAFDITSPLVTGRSITNVVVSGTTFTINMSVTTGMTAGNIIVVKDNNGVSRTCDGAFVIVSINPGVSVTVTGKSVGNGTYAGGTVDSYYPIYTLHNSVGGVNGADTGKYTPSPPFCPSLGIYGFDKYGIPTSTPADIVYEGIGVFFNGATSTSISYTISYGSGKNKNDNHIKLGSSQASIVAGAGNPFDFTISQFEKIHGSDFILSVGGTNKFRVLFNNRTKYSIHSSINMNSASGGTTNVNIRENGNIVKTALLINNSASAISMYKPLDYEKQINANTYIDFYLSSIGLNTPELRELNIEFEIL